jgi:DnaJ like chaperone protein
MSLWKRLLDLAGHAFHPAPSDERVANNGSSDPCSPDPNDTDFAAAVVALAAKMARADGKSTLDEAAAFRAAFPISTEERPLFDRLFKLAQETVHGYVGYARRIGKRYQAKPCLLEDVLDVLFAVAAADGAITPGELTYLEKVADLFGFTETEFARISAPYFPDRAPDPYTILSVSIQASDEDIRRAWMRCVSENHPDRFIARGAPVDFIKAAHEKTAAINAAYEQIKASRNQKTKRDRRADVTTDSASPAGAQ